MNHSENICDFKNIKLNFEFALSFCGLIFLRVLLVLRTIDLKQLSLLQVIQFLFCGLKTKLYIWSANDVLRINEVG